MAPCWHEVLTLSVCRHEGAGSLYALLKARGWATALSAGTSNSFSARSFFDVNVDLTDEGLGSLVYMYRWRATT